MKGLSNGQVNLLLTMFMAEATGTDPFEIEGELRDKGIIDNVSSL